MLAEEHAVGQVGEEIVTREMRDLRFGAAPLGDVLVHRHPAAVRHRTLRHGDDAPVHEFLRERRRFARGLRGGRRGELLGARERTRPARRPVAFDALQRRSGAPVLAPEAVHLEIGRVAHDQALLGVEHAQPVRHVVERDVDAAVERLQLVLARDQLDGVVLEHFDRACHLAHLVGVGAGRDRRGVVVPGKANHGLREVAEPRQDAMHGRKPDRTDQDECRDRADQDRDRQRLGGSQHERDRLLRFLQAAVAILADQQRHPVGDVHVVLGVLGGLVLGELVGVIGHLLTGLVQRRQARVDAPLERVRREVARLRDDLLHEIGQPLRDRVHLLPAAIDALPIDLRRHALDDPPVLLQQEPEARGAQGAEEPVIVEAVGRGLGRLGEVDRGGRLRGDHDDRQNRKAVELGGDAAADSLQDVTG